MRNLYLILFFGSSLILLSCGSSGKFEVINNTTDFIDSIYITPDRKLGHNYITLLADEKRRYETDMSVGNADGAYRIYYKIKSEFKSVIFGYYSNSAFLEKMIQIDIRPDTVLFKFEQRD